jgi:folylpolyglutamate synthase
MIERILRGLGYKTGLFTSPHLIDVRERIRINGEPIDKESFLKTLRWTFDTLKEKATDDAGMPAYFRFLTLVGLKTFLDQNVDVVILEVGLGGRLDATNCVQNPVVCGVSSLGFDHMDLLGHTLPEIAREKGGIFKTGVPAFSVPQPADALAALHDKARELGTEVKVVRPLQEYSLPKEYDTTESLTLGIAGEHQKINASLAVALAGMWEGTIAHSKNSKQVEGGAERAAQIAEGTLPKEYIQGLSKAFWPGRSQIFLDTTVPVNKLSFFLDGAHTEESMATCADWFADSSSSSSSSLSGKKGNTSSDDEEGELQRVLLFNCTPDRDPQKLLKPLAENLAARGVFPHHALFVPPDSTYMKLGPAGAPPELTWQINLRSTWQDINGRRMSDTKMQGVRALPLPLPPGLSHPALSAAQESINGAVLPNLQMALDWLRKRARETPPMRLQVLVTGSLYLVGDLLKLLSK